MNYFPFNPDPRASAIALDDKRLTRVFHEATMTLSKAQWNGLDKKGCSWGCHGAPVWAFDGIDAELRRLALI